jgi:hypothetical protein
VRPNMLQQEVPSVCIEDRVSWQAEDDHTKSRVDIIGGKIKVGGARSIHTDQLHIPSRSCSDNVYEDDAPLLLADAVVSGLDTEVEHEEDVKEGDVEALGKEHHDVHFCCVYCLKEKPVGTLSWSVPRLECVNRLARLCHTPLRGVWGRASRVTRAGSVAHLRWGERPNPSCLALSCAFFNSRMTERPPFNVSFIMFHWQNWRLRG